MRQRVSGDAYGAHFRWSPATFDDITLILGHARGEDTFRQTGLQGEADVFGELYQPELSNLIVDTIGIEFKLFDEIDLGLFRHEFRQDQLAEEMRDVAIEADTEGDSKSLGHEIDLVLSFDVKDLEIELIAAEFEAGSAYDDFKGETSRFWQIELTYVF